MNLRAKLVCSIGLLAMLSLMLPGSLRADSYTYTYTGNPFGYNGSVYPLTGVSGTFTLSSPLAFDTTTDLAPGTVGSSVASYSFTDGNSSWTSGNFVLAPPAYPFGPQNAFTCNEGAACNTGLSQDGVNNWNFDYNADLGGGGVYGSYSQGSWVSPVVSTPEPSSLLVLAIGLLCLLVVAGRRRFAAARQPTI
jgi:PEP-CTERM motif